MPFKKSVVREYFETIVVAVILALFMRTFVVQAFKIPTGSMEPNLLIGDHLLVNKFVFAPTLSGAERAVLPSADIRRAEVERYAALDALERVRALAGNDIRRAASDLAAAVERLERYEGTLLAAAARSAQAADFAFERGAISVLEMLDARRTLRAVRLEALAARAEHARALAAWRAAQTTVDMLGQP